MTSMHVANKQMSEVSSETATRPSRRKSSGPATAALLIQIASEILTASPTMRQRAHITLTDLAAADKVRKSLLKAPATANHN